MRRADEELVVVGAEPMRRIALAVAGPHRLRDSVGAFVRGASPSRPTGERLVGNTAAYMPYSTSPRAGLGDELEGERVEPVRELGSAIARGCGRGGT